MVTRDEELKWAYLLDPCFELTNSAGKPLTDGYIEVYIAGTRNKYYCASDFAGTLHPFQIPLDSLGSNIVLANPDNAYDVYVYNRFGNLIMSRYNVTPADGGAVISNTERINELEELVVSAVTGLQGQIDDINEALDGKKDKQEEYSVTLTPTQTVSAIMQNENGEIEVIYQEIDLPEEVPNVNIVSPASTINITTHIDEETNTKTFSIDLSDLGHLEYGQFMATNTVETGANMYRIKGNLGTTLDGKIQLHKGNSYHITVRGYYTCNDLTNTSDTLNYIEYSSFTPMPVNVDNTVAGPQYFEISYDIFKLSADTNYYIAFVASAGKVSNLTVEVHSLSNISILAPESYYQEGWGIDIVSSVISVDPTIFNDYSTHTEVYEATVTAIQAATSVVPEIEQSDWAEDDPEAPSYIKNKPDLDIYATHDEVYESSVSSIQLVTGLIPDTSEYATHTEVYEAVVTGVQLATSVIPDVSDFTTHDEVHESIVSALEYVTGIIPDAQVQSDWTETDTSDPAYIQNKPNEYSLVAGQNIGIVVDNIDREIVISASATDLSGCATKEELQDGLELVTGLIPDVSNFATHTEVYDSSVTAIQLVTGLIPDVSDFTTHDEVYEAVVTGVQLATSMIPEQLEAGQYISIEDNTINVTGLQPEGDYATNTEVSEAIVTAIQVATGAIPDPLEAGQYVSIENNVITVTGLQEAGDYVTHDELTEAVTGIEQDLDGKKDKQESIEFEGSTTKTITKIIQDDNGVVSAIYEDIEMQNVLEAGQYVSIVNDVITVTGLQPEGDYATNADVYDATVTAVNIATAAIPDVSEFTTHTEVYNATVTAIETVTAMIPDAQVQSDWNQSDDTKPDYIKNKPNLNQYATDIEVSNAIVTAIETVTALIPAAQVQSDWDETDTSDPSYIQNKPDLDIYVTHDELIEVVSAVTGSGDFGQFYCASGTGACEMSKVRGTIDVTNDGKIVLEQGKSYHVTVRGGYDNTALANVDTTIGLIEYISNRTIQVNVDRTVTGVQYFEISYDLYNLGADTNYYVFFTGVNGYGSIKELFIEIHTLGGAGSGSGGGSGADYTPGYGINILNNVISLDTSVLPDPQVQSDWAETDNTDVSYIKNKPTELNLIEGPGIHIAQDNNNLIISAAASGYVTEAEVYNAVVTGVQVATGLIPDVSDMATQTWVGNQGFLTSIPSTYATDSEVYDATVTAIQIATSVIPDTSDMATKTWVGNQGYLTSVPDTYATDTEVSEAIATATNDMATQTWVGNQGYLTSVPDTYATDAEVSQAIASSVSGLATKVELSNVEATIPTVQLNGDNQVTAINNHEIAGTGGSTYTAGDYISIENDEISVTGIGNLVAGNNITITESGNDITISAAGGGSSTYTAGQYVSIDSNNVISVTGLQVAGSYATTSDISDMATQTWVGNQGYLTSVPSNYATDTEVSEAIASSITDFVTEDQVTALIPESEEVEFEELDITQFAQTSAIPTIQLNSSDQVTGIDGHAIAGGGGGGGTTYTAGNYVSIDSNNVISVTGVAAATAIPTLPDTEVVDFEVLDITQFAQASAIPDVSNLATKVYVDGAVSGKQDKLTAGSNISISGNTIAVTGMPASPVQSDWNETNTSSLAFIKNKPDLSAYATTSAMETSINASKATFNRVSNTGTTNLSQLTTTGVGAGKLTVNLSSIFNTSYSMIEWTYCDTNVYWGVSDKCVYWFTFCARLDNIVATQWSRVNNAIQLKTTNAVFMSGIRAICGDSWSSPTSLVVFNDGAWTPYANVIRRDIRNSSTADNNTYYIWFSGYIYIPV